MEINRLELVRNRARNLYDKYSLSVPVDLNEIIKIKDIDIAYKENRHGIDGWTKIQKEPPYIEINSEITFEPRKRFTIAHELGHIFIPWHTGVVLCSLDDPSYKIQGQRMVNTQELEANTFASELLMPTEWLQKNFDLKNASLSELIVEIKAIARTSTIAILYALENALPSGHIYLVQTLSMEYWKPFKSKNSGTFNVSIMDNIEFYDKICVHKENFEISTYNIVHYTLLPCPNIKVIQSIYVACNYNIELFLNAISDYQPIKIIHFIDTILDNIQDKFYFVLRVGNIFRHLKSKDINMRLHEEYYDFFALVAYANKYYNDSGLIELGEEAYLLWIKDSYRYVEAEFIEIEPHELLKEITNEVYFYDTDLGHTMLQKINGIVSSINSLNQNAERECWYHLMKQRFETDPEYQDVISHKLFDTYLSNKISSLLRKRALKQLKGGQVKSS